MGYPAGLDPSEPPSLYNMVCYKTQNLLAGAADFLCLSAVSSLSGGLGWRKGLASLISPCEDCGRLGTWDCPGVVWVV